jgi:small subunit ribosomal protein S13
MARIAGVDIPRNKQVWVSLQYIYGIGSVLSQQILARAEISPETKVNELTEEEVNHLREIIDKQYRVEGDLRREVNLNVKRLIEIGSYRGIRHRHNLPSRGQRTRTNARSRRGTRRTVAGRGQRRGMTKK